ncbi:hypothetical protein ACLQ2N_08150 [Streptomyces sp. DT224]|uniref:hypothetical protein n=1 Tax=Streptomyces sp. DT224 TaxID=3393426 RepID=UPI003CEF5509
MGAERPIPERLGDQTEQAQHLRRTGNGPTVEDEQQLLAEAYGAPDMAGFYTGPAVDQDTAEADDQAADDTADGGEQA